MDRRSHVSVFTDGSCCGNPGPGGYAVIIKNGKSYQEIVGSTLYSTNNRMELMAVIKGLAAVKPCSHVTVYTDSGYIERAVNEGRLAIWQQNGWQRIRSGEPVRNRDQWMVLTELIRNRNLDVQFVKLKAHKSNYFNNRADKLAKQAAKSA